MPALKIHSVEGKGDLANECVWLDVTEDVANLSFHILSDTTYTDTHSISNELRHIFWFPSQAVKARDWIKVMTKDGTNTVTRNSRGTTTHVLYWKLGRTVWNKDGDAAILFTLSTWNTTRA